MKFYCSYITIFKVGLWIYELAGMLPNGESVLLNCHLMSTNKKFKVKTPVHTVVQKWINILKEKGHPHTILVFDSYYFSAMTRNYFLKITLKCVQQSPAANSLR